jgi:hypothetical protein
MKELKDHREILAELENGKITIEGKRSLAHCKNILEQNGSKYTDEQVERIRDFLYAMATIDYLFFTEQYLKKNTLTSNQNHDEQESIPLYQSEYRRAS